MEYIDKEKAIDKIDEWLDSVGSIIVGKGLTSYGELVGCLEDAPAADVVEVVRCKDCAYYKNGLCMCGEKETSYATDLFQKPDDFCSYGVRKDGEK